MLMRPLTTQVTKEWYFSSPGSYSMKFAWAALAGYKQYDAVLIGAAGGKSGQAPNAGGVNTLGRAGGGGGGSLRLRGNLTAAATFLPDMPCTVGAAGTNGANSGNNAKAGNGTKGGDSALGFFSAYGGFGGSGGDFAGNTSSGYIATKGYGGDGGGNSAGLGAGGLGGVGPDYSWDSSGSPNYVAGANATAGTYVVGGTGDVIGGGKGGGAGRPGLSGWANGAAGATGNSTGMSATGSALSSIDSGSGGGANAAGAEGFDGVADYHGQEGATPTRAKDGLVWVKLT
jgi:hypothetical protein